MRNPVFAIFLAFVFVVPFIMVGCENGTDLSERRKYSYRYGTDIIVPDSLKDDQAEWIKEATRAADQHLKTEDYEDPEDVIEEAHRVSNDIFGRKVEGLYIDRKDGHYEDFYPFEELTPKQKEIFIELKNSI